MSDNEKILSQIRRSPAHVRYADLYKLCVAHFGSPQQSGSSHAVFKTPWPGDPRVNIQNAKPYQVRQALVAIDKVIEMQKMENPE